MSEKTLNLTIEFRSSTGTTGSNALRAAGKLPAVIYGHGAKPQPIAVDARQFAELWNRGARSSLVTLVLDGKASDTALVREVQRDPVSSRIVHIDLQRVSVHESIHARLPVVTVGVARGVRDSGGVMDVITHELEVSGPADELPDQLTIDVSNMGIHDHVLAGSIALPASVKMITPADALVVSIEASKTARQVEEAAFVTSEQPEPEVIGQKKEAE